MVSKLSFFLTKRDIVEKYFKNFSNINIITDNIEDISCNKYTKKSYIIINNRNKILEQK